MLSCALSCSNHPGMAFASFGAFNKKPKPKRKRCGDCAGCLVVDDCNQCKYCLDKPRNGGSNTLRRPENR